MKQAFPRSKHTTDDLVVNMHLLWLQMHFARSPHRSPGRPKLKIKQSLKLTKILLKTISLIPHYKRSNWVFNSILFKFKVHKLIMFVSLNQPFGISLTGSILPNNAETQASQLLSNVYSQTIGGILKHDNRNILGSTTQPSTVSSSGSTTFGTGSNSIASASNREQLAARILVPAPNNTVLGRANSIFSTRKTDSSAQSITSSIKNSTFLLSLYLLVYCLNTIHSIFVEEAWTC